MKKNIFFILLFLPTFLFSQYYVDELVVGSPMPSALNSVPDPSDPDHTQAIISAISIIEDGGVLLLRAGRYNIDDDGLIIQIQKPLTINGAGKEHTIIYTPSHPDLATMFSVQSSDVTIEGISFNSVRDTASLSYVGLTTSNNRAIVSQIDSTRNIQIKNCSFTDMDLGIKINDSKKVLIRDCDFRQCAMSALLNDITELRMINLTSIRDSIEEVTNKIHHFYLNSPRDMWASSIYCKGMKTGKSFNLKIGVVGDALVKNIIIEGLIAEETGAVYIGKNTNTIFENPIFINSPGFSISESNLVQVYGVDFNNTSDTPLSLFTNAGTGSEIHFHGGSVKGPVNINTTNFKEASMSEVYFENPFDRDEAGGFGHIITSSTSVSSEPYVYFKDCTFMQNVAGGNSNQRIFDIRDNSRFSISNCNFILGDEAVARKYISLALSPAVGNETAQPYIDFKYCKKQGFSIGFIAHENEALVPLKNFYIHKSCRDLVTNSFVPNTYKNNTVDDYMTRGQSYFASNSNMILSSIDAARNGHEITVWNTNPDNAIKLATEGTETIGGEEFIVVKKSTRLMAIINENNVADWKVISGEQPELQYKHLTIILDNVDWTNGVTKVHYRIPNWLDLYALSEIYYSVSTNDNSAVDDNKIKLNFDGVLESDYDAIIGNNSHSHVVGDRLVFMNELIEFELFDTSSSPPSGLSVELKFVEGSANLAPQ